MKKLVASFSAAALGTAAVQAAYAPGLSTQESSKPWSLALDLRGFYDDNYLTAPKDSSNIRESFGFDVRPSIGLNLPLENTYIGLDLTYSAKYYTDSARSSDPWDQSFFFDAALDHAFSSQHTVQIDNRLAYTDEPAIVSGGTPFRTDANYLWNRGAITYNAGLAPRWGAQVGYLNNYWDYRQDNPAAETSPSAAVPPLPPGPLYSPTRSALLDRIGNNIDLNLRYQLQPDTVGLIGGRFQMVDYTSNEFITQPVGPPFAIPPIAPTRADSRNSRSYIGYVGGEHNFTSLMSLSVKAGAQWIDFYNDSTVNSEVSPWGNLDYNYNYRPGSSLTAGLGLYRAATDVAAGTTDTLNTSVYAGWTHAITARVTGSLTATYQWSQFQNGLADRDTQNFFVGGLRLAYKINRFLSADAAYTFSGLDSTIPNRDYTRNRVYIGLTGRY